MYQLRCLGKLGIVLSHLWRRHSHTKLLDQHSCSKWRHCVHSGTRRNPVTSMRHDPVSCQLRGLMGKLWRVLDHVRRRDSSAYVQYLGQRCTQRDGVSDHQWCDSISSV
jgi:hypothetical protein